MRTKLFAALGALVVIGAIAAHHFGWIGGVVELGVAVPVTGPQAAIGAAMRNAIQLAIDEQNAKGGIHGRKVKMVLRDTHNPGDAYAALASFAKQGKDAKVLSMIEYEDPSCADAYHRDMLEDEDFGNVFVGRTACAPGWNQFRQFQFFPPATDLIGMEVAFAKDVLKVSRFAYLRDDTIEGQEYITLFWRMLGYAEHRMVSGDDPVVFHPDATDFSAALAKVKEKNADAVVYGGNPRLAGQLVAALRAGGYQGAFFVINRWPSTEVIAAGKAAAEGTYQAFPGPPMDATPEGKAFLAAYNAHGFAEPATWYSLPAWIAAQAALSAIDKSFLNIRSVRGALQHEKLDTAMGPFEFDVGDEERSAGSSYRTLVIYKVVNGAWVPFYGEGADKKLKAY